MKKYVFFVLFSLSSALFGAVNEGKIAVASLQKAEAAVLNGAIGDALGRVTEFIGSTEKIHKLFPVPGVTQLKQALLPQVYNVKVVPYTDDTVMSLIVAQVSIKAQRELWSIEQILAELTCQFGFLFIKNKSDALYGIRAHGIGNANALSPVANIIDQNSASLKITDTPQKMCANCSLFAQAIKPFIDARQKHSTTHEFIKSARSEAGCGSVMRAWPLGIIYAHDIATMKEIADKQSRITHRNPLARAASVAMAVGTAYAYLGKSVEEIVMGMIQAAEAFDAEELLYKIQAKKLTQNQKPTKKMLIEDKLLTSDMIRYAYESAQSGQSSHDIFGTLDNRGPNYRSVTGALLGWAGDEAVAGATYLFARYAPTKNVQQAIIDGVNTPGDSDSIASLAGVLMGAYTGIMYKDTNLDILENKDFLEQTAADLVAHSVLVTTGNFKVNNAQIIDANVKSKHVINKHDTQESVVRVEQDHVMAQDAGPKDGLVIPMILEQEITQQAGTKGKHSKKATMRENRKCSALLARKKRRLIRKKIAKKVRCRRVKNKATEQERQKI